MERPRAMSPMVNPSLIRPSKKFFDFGFFVFTDAVTYVSIERWFPRKVVFDGDTLVCEGRIGNRYRT